MHEYLALALSAPSNLPLLCFRNSQWRPDSRGMADETRRHPPPHAGALSCSGRLPARPRCLWWLQRQGPPSGRAGHAVLTRILLTSFTSASPFHECSNARSTSQQHDKTPVFVTAGRFEEHRWIAAGADDELSLFQWFVFEFAWR